MIFPNTMLSHMPSWKWTRVLVVLGISIAGSDANSAYSNTTASNPRSNNTITCTSTLTVPATITSCASVNFTTYLVPSLQALPSASLEAYFNSQYIKLNIDLGNLERYADSPITNTVAYESLLFAELSTLSADIDSLYGSVGHGVLSFQNIATTDPCLFSTCLASYLAESSVIAPLLPPGVFDFGYYTASPPCCGQCTITASGVQIAYWPTPAPIPSVSVLVNQYNVSYISPSVYVFFTSLNAANLCGPVGSTYPLELGTFAPGALSTSSLPTIGIAPSLGVWSSINYADFDSPKCICTTNCQYDSLQNQYLTDICTPQLSIPPIVQSLDPLWASCANNLFGVFDPPIALTLQAGLTTPKSTPAQTTAPGGGNPPPQSTAVPVNGPTPTSPAPPPTPQLQTANAPSTANQLPQNGPSSVNVSPAGESPSPASVGGTPTPSPGSVTTTIAPSLVVNGQPVAANSQGNFVVGTQTLTTNSQGNIVIGTQTLAASGPAITVSGTTISLAPEATEIIYEGTSTTRLGSSIQSSVGVTAQLGNIIQSSASGTTHSGIVIQSSIGVTTAPAQYTGEAGRRVEMETTRAVFMVVAFSALEVWLWL